MAAVAENQAELPLRVALRAEEVVATGRSDNVLQVPSPIYTATFTDAHHVLVGAGGGGRKFGMANIALLLRVQSLDDTASSTSASISALAAPCSPDTNSNNTTSSSAAAASSERRVWDFAAAIDLGGDIPWCTSSFLPFRDDGPSSSCSSTDACALCWSDGQQEILRGLLGFVALSSIDSFALIGVYRGREPTSQPGAPDAATLPSVFAERGTDTGDGDSRYLRLLARVAVPSDPKDSDKKPIALVQNLLFVAHDEKGVSAFALTDLVPDSYEDADPAAYMSMYQEQLTMKATKSIASAANSSSAALQRRVPRVCTEASPVASWDLPARANDLSANRICMVHATSTTDTPNGTTAPSQSIDTIRPAKAHPHEYVVLAAVLQNKTVVLTTLRLRKRYGKESKSGGTNRRRRAEATPSKDAMPGDISMLPKPSRSTASMATALTLTDRDLYLPFKLLTSSLRLVRLFGWNDIKVTEQHEMLRRLSWDALQDPKRPTHGPLCSLMVVAFDTHANESFILHGAVVVQEQGGPAALSVKKTASKDTEASLRLNVLWTKSDPAPVLSDAITSLSMCDDAIQGDYAARVRRSPVGAAVPTHWIAGTVEGWVVSLRYDVAERTWYSDHIRPSLRKSVAQRFPALHKEPVSCVAVSAENDVVSADIAQNVALTTMPCVVDTAAGEGASKLPSGNGVPAKGAPATMLMRRLPAASSLFPSTTSEESFVAWALAELSGGSSAARLLLFLAVPLLLLLVAVIITRR